MSNHKDSEKWLERTHAKKMKENGGKSIKLECNFEAGLPDRLCITRNGRHFYIEFKSKGKKPSPIQKIRHRELRALCCDVYVIDNETDMLATLRIGEPLTPTSDRTIVRYFQDDGSFEVESFHETVFNYEKEFVRKTKRIYTD